MSLNSREQRALTAIERSLSASAPELASLLSTFNRLAEGEAMPVRRRNRRPRRGTRNPPAAQVRALQRFSQMCVVLWVAVSAALVALAVTLSGYGPRACQVPSAGACCQVPHSAASAARCHRL